MSPDGSHCLHAELHGARMVLDDFVSVGDVVEFRADFDDDESGIVAKGIADHYDADRDVWVFR